MHCTDCSRPIENCICSPFGGKHSVSASVSNDLLCCDVIEEFTDSIPKHINDMPAFCSNGVTRNEMEWKHMAFAMAKEIINLRKAT